MIRNRQELSLTLLIVTLVVMVALLVTGSDKSDGSDDATTRPATASAIAPDAEAEEQFCTAFEAMAAARGNHESNDTPATHNAVLEAGRLVLILASDTEIPRLAREALTHLVNGLIGGSATSPSAQADAALHTFLQHTCPAG